VTGVDGQLVGGTGVVAKYANFVKLPHTLFALPFALVGVTLGTMRVDATLRTIALVVVAFTAARFAAMGFNRIVDREFDAKNPRTAMRELPAGTMSVSQAWGAVLAASAIFLIAAWLLNPICLALSPIALAWVFFYSYTKRFTSFAHLVLGLGLAIAPVGGFLAVTGYWSEPWWVLVALALAVATWTAGFDIIYALQDIEFDRGAGLHSIPARFGEDVALGISRGLHFMTFTFLGAVGFGAGLGRYYMLGVLVAGMLLAYEHHLVWRANPAQVDKAFFRVNMALSTIFFAFVLAERLMPFKPLWTSW
jgi:4-hydroxybenzoate polyprenyltransferase